MEKIIPELTNEEIETAEVVSMTDGGYFSVNTESEKLIQLNIRDVLHLLKNVCEKDVANHE